MRLEEPEKWAKKVKDARERALNALSGGESTATGNPAAPPTQNALSGGLNARNEVPDTRDACSPAQRIYAEVTGLFTNPRLMHATDSQGMRYSVVVGNSRLFWIGAPVILRPSPDYGTEFYELAEAPPAFRGDKRYVLRIEDAIQRERSASSH
jgi:hypothetical protein